MASPSAQTPSPSVPGKRRARRKTFSFGSKNKDINASDNVRRDRQIRKRKICQTMQDDDNPNSKRMGVNLDREGFLGSEGRHLATTPDCCPPTYCGDYVFLRDPPPFFAEKRGCLKKDLWPSALTIDYFSAWFEVHG